MFRVLSGEEMDNLAMVILRALAAKGSRDSESPFLDSES
jgi:hypothetical protein